MSLRHSRGFTLIEIVVALTVMAVIGAGTIPYLKQKIDVARATKSAEEMKGWLAPGPPTPIPWSPRGT